MGQFQAPLREARFGSLVHLGYRGWVATAYLLVALLAGSSLFIEFRGIDEQINTLARERGAVLFRLIALTRDWNARHGGVYVPVTETTQPNPYLTHPRRDLETLDGVCFHITSLKPVRPANLADIWETEAFHRFEQGSTEILELIFEERGPQYRYMAPLLIKQACLNCHAEHGYRLGDIRGGMSITMPAGKILAVHDAQRSRTAAVFGGGALCLALLIHLAIPATAPARCWARICAAWVPVVTIPISFSGCGNNSAAKGAGRGRSGIAVRTARFTSYGCPFQASPTKGWKVAGAMWRRSSTSRSARKSRSCFAIGPRATR